MILLRAIPVFPSMEFQRQEWHWRAISAQSRVWFTASHGIINEVYYPSIDRANTRDFGFVVTDGASFSEEKREAHHEEAMLGPGVPAYPLTNTCSEGRYRISKRTAVEILLGVCGRRGS